MTIEFPNKEIGGHEATIVIEGVQLNYSESMTLRVAMSNFIIDMRYNGLGDDEHGKFMTESYLKDARRIEKMIVEACNNANKRG